MESLSLGKVILYTSQWDGLYIGIIFEYMFLVDCVISHSIYSYSTYSTFQLGVHLL